MSVRSACQLDWEDIPSVTSIFLCYLITEKVSSGKSTSWTHPGISGQVEGVAIIEQFIFSPQWSPYTTMKLPSLPAWLRCGGLSVSLRHPPTSSINRDPLATCEHEIAESLIRNKPRQIQKVRGPASQEWSSLA